MANANKNNHPGFGKPTNNTGAKGSNRAKATGRKATKPRKK